MNRVFYQFLRHDLQFYIFLLVAFFMPLTKEYLPYLMFLWVFSGVLSVRKMEFNYTKFQWFLILIPAIFYFYHVIGMIYTSDFKSGLFDLEMKLSLLFAPVVILFLTDKVKQNTGLILKAFILGNIAALAICLFYAFDHSFITNDAGQLVFEPSYWPTERELSFVQLINHRYAHFSHSFLSLIHHPSYFSMYILCAACFLVYLYRKYDQRKQMMSVIMFSVLLLFLSVMIWFLGSRAGYLTFIALFAGISIFFMLKTKKYLISLGFIIFGFIVLTFFMSPQIKINIDEVVSQVEQNEELTSESDIRLWLWKSGFDIFKENYIFGVGTGDISDELNHRYQKYNLTLAEDHNYNAHNQYIETTLGLGIIGLLILLLWLIGIIAYAFKQKDFILFFLAIIIAINFMFESMLSTIAGVSFFAFYYSLLILRKK